MNQISLVKKHNELLKLISLTKHSFVAIGRLLYEIYQNESYKEVVGDGIDSWVEYLAQPEIGLSKGDASRLMQVYEKFVLELGYSEEEIGEIPNGNMKYLLPVVKKDVKDVDKLVDSAKNLSQRDFRDTIYDIKNNYEKERTYSFVIMKRCNETGTLTKGADIASSEIERFLKQYD